jgi:putative membrane protein
MTPASKRLTDAQRGRINEAVKAAELRTSAEIVPVLATASGRYDRAEDIVGLWCAAVAIAVVWAVWPFAQPEPGTWGGMPGWVQLLAMLAAMVLAFIFGAVIGSRIAWLRRLFTPRQQMLDEVQLAARQAFFDSRVHHTAGSTGVLIYVSLFEHLDVVLIDQQVLDKVGQSAIDDVCKKLTTKLHDGDVSQAYVDAIQSLGELLAGPLPRQANDVDELPNALVLLD